jgi:uncharacterized membrane protein
MFQKATETDITSDDKLWVLLAWILTPIVPVIILLIADKKNRPFIKAHNGQALAWGIILWVVSIILSFVVIGACVGALGFLFNIFLGIKAYQGNYIKLPLITDFVKKQNWG